MSTKQATREELGDFAVVTNRLFGFVQQGKRPAKETIARVQAIADNQPDPSTPTEFGSILTPAGFTRQELQLARLRQWNQSWGLGGFFHDQQFHDAMLASPFYSWERPTASVVLCWAGNHLEQTMEFSLSALRQVYGEKLYVSPDLLIDAEHLSPACDAPELQPNRLWWEVLDLNANRDKAPDQVPPETAAGIQVLQAAAQHPAYVARMNGTDVPYWDVPGLRVKVSGESEPYAPFVFGLSDGLLYVVVNRAGTTISDFAGVAVRES